MHNQERGLVWSLVEGSKIRLGLATRRSSKQQDSNIEANTDKEKNMPNKNFNNLHKGAGNSNAQRGDNAIYEKSVTLGVTHPASGQHGGSGVHPAASGVQGKSLYNGGAKGNNASNKG